MPEFGSTIMPVGGGGDTDWALLRGRDLSIPSPIAIESFATYDTGNDTLITTGSGVSGEIHRFTAGMVVNINTNLGDTEYNGTHTVQAAGLTTYAFTIDKDYVATSATDVRVYGPPASSVTDASLFITDTVGDGDLSGTNHVTALTMKAYMGGDATAIVDADFGATPGFCKVTGDGAYTVDTSTYLTSLGTALVDADFGSNGFMKRNGAGSYSIDGNTYAKTSGTTGSSFKINDDTTGSDFVLINVSGEGTDGEYIALRPPSGGVSSTKDIYLPDAEGTIALLDNNQVFASNVTATNFIATGQVMAGGGVGEPGNILLNPQNAGMIMFEGENVGNNFHTSITPAEPTAINTLTLPDDTGTVMLNLIEDASPELGGDLNLNGQDIIGAGDILLVPALETATKILATYNSSGARKFRIDCTNDHVSGEGFLELLSDAGVYNHINNARSIIKDEDDMASDSNKHLATQQSIRKYIYNETRYSYEYISCNYNSLSASLQYFPLGSPPTEYPSLSSANKEYVSFLCPHDGVVYKLFWRPSTAQTSGTAFIKMYIGEEGDAYATDLNFQTRLAGFTVSANSTYINEIGVTTTLQTGGFGGNISNEFEAGDVISLGIDPTVIPGDVNCTVVLKYDMTT